MNTMTEKAKPVAWYSRLLNADWFSGSSHFENLALSLALGLMIMLPLAEILLRSLFSTGITGSQPLVQHLTLVAGMLGAAVAARENRLLKLSTASLLKGRLAAVARLLSGTIAAAVSLFLCISSAGLVLTERLGGGVLAYSIPIWIVQLILPVGFGLISLRLVLHASDHAAGRWLVAIVAGLIVAVFAWLPLDPAHVTVPAVSILLLATLLGTPVFVTLGGVALILFWGQGTPIAVVALDHYSLVVNSTLPMIPLFTAAGFFLAESGAPRRLIRVFQALFGRLRGGAALVSVLVCTFFTAFTGASGVTILALGGLLMPLLLSAGQPRKSALGLITGGGSPGVLLIPALPLILYAIVASVNIKTMFLGALLPAVVMFTLTAGWGVRQGSHHRIESPAFNWREARASVAAAKWELLLPVVPIGAIFGGLATPVEAAALTACYAFLVETFVHRDLKLTSDIPRVLSESGLLVGSILLILGVALAFTNYLVDAQIPDRALEWVTGSIESRWIFLLTLNMLLLAVGCVMDIFSATIVLAPLIVPIGLAFGIDPVHLGVIFLANMELGFLTPPVGMNLFFASSRFRQPLAEVYRSVIPLFLVLCGGVLIITYVPWLSTVLPTLTQP